METKRLQAGLLYLVVSSVLAFVIGCGEAAPAPAPANKEPAKPTGAAPAKTPVAEKKADALSGLAELSPADRALAEKQKICPVSDEELGKHGKPIKITVKGQIVFLCCSGCEDSIKKNPDKYLAKLKLTPKAGM